MTHSEATAVVGKRGYITLPDGMMVHVTVRDVRTNWGKDQYLCDPMAGAQPRWKDADKVTLFAAQDPPTMRETVLRCARRLEDNGYAADANDLRELL